MCNRAQILGLIDRSGRLFVILAIFESPAFASAHRETARFTPRTILFKTALDFVLDWQILIHRLQWLGWSLKAFSFRLGENSWSLLDKLNWWVIFGGIWSIISFKIYLKFWEIGLLLPLRISESSQSKTGWISHGALWNPISAGDLWNVVISRTSHILVECNRFGRPWTILLRSLGLSIRLFWGPINIWILVCRLLRNVARLFAIPLLYVN